jgi:hypothetical protein
MPTLFIRWRAYWRMPTRDDPIFAAWHEYSQFRPGILQSSRQTVTHEHALSAKADERRCGETLCFTAGLHGRRVKRYSEVFASVDKQWRMKHFRLRKTAAGDKTTVGLTRP